MELSEKEYETMFHLEDHYWWYAGLRDLIFSYINDHAPKGRVQRILDAGTGTGGFLARCTDYQAYGIEIAEGALAFCRKRGLSNFVRGSICDIPFEDNYFDVAVSSDVLSYLDAGDDIAALHELHRVLGKGGVLLLNLPAYEFLYSLHDAAVHTQHRYTSGELKEKVKGAGFEIETITYRNTILFPIALAKRLVEKVVVKDPEGAASDLKALPGPVNRFLIKTLLLENRLLSKWRLRLPFGLSIFCAVRKVG